MVRYKVQDLFDFMESGRIDPEGREANPPSGDDGGVCQDNEVEP